MALTPYEQETIIRFSEEDDTLLIYTASKKMCSKFKKLGYRLVKQDKHGGYFEGRLSMLTFRKANKKDYTISLEEKQIRAERMKQVRQQKSTGAKITAALKNPIKFIKDLKQTQAVGMITMPTITMPENINKFIQKVEGMRNGSF